LEQSKEALVSSLARGKPVERSVEVISMCLATNQTLIDVVILSGERGESVALSTEAAQPATNALQDVQAGLSPDEYQFVEKICKQYEPLLDALRQRGLNPDHLTADAWCTGHTGPDCDPTERICWASMFIRDPEADSFMYARPIEGIEIRISLTKKEIIRFEDNALGVFPIPGSFEAKSNYVKPEDMRTDLKPIVISQPEGPSWTITDGTTVEWQRWNVQVGFNSKEGTFCLGFRSLFKVKFECFTPFIFVANSCDYLISSTRRNVAWTYIPWTTCYAQNELL